MDKSTKNWRWDKNKLRLFDVNSFNEGIEIRAWNNGQESGYEVIGWFDSDNKVILGSFNSYEEAYAWIDKFVSGL